MKSYIIIISTVSTLLLAIGHCFAQQTPLFPEYNYNPFVINPAYAGMTNGTEATLSHYGYLNGIDGSPQTSSLSFHSPISNGNMGIGAVILRDKIGVSNTTNFLAAYSYKLFFDHKQERPNWQIYDENVLSFSLTIGIKQHQENLLDLDIANDPLFDHNINATIPTIGFGFLYNKKHFYLGISAPNVIGNRLASQDDIHITNPFYGYFGYRFFTNIFEEVMIKPNILLKHEQGAPLQLDLNIAINYKNKLEIGTGYRSSSSFNFLAGIYALEHFKLVYFYNIPFKSTMSGNAHGLLLSYHFSKMTN